MDVFFQDPHDLGALVTDDSNNAIGILSSMPNELYSGNTAIYTFFKNHNEWIDIAIKEIKHVSNREEYYKLVTPKLQYFGGESSSSIFD